ncbi:MAG: DUF2723 domain-containing protein [Sphingobacterium sp.]|nr:DUF2723 domain-containing protein [Sphingobacterium sp.]
MLRAGQAGLPGVVGRGVLALVFLAGHLPFLASTLEDVDSVNFALGLRDFDPGRHRPHPPGYPIYMALGKAANLVLSEPHALAFWGALFGALSAFALLRLFAALDAHRRRAGQAPDRPAPVAGRGVARPARRGDGPDDDGAAFLDDGVPADERHRGPRGVADGAGHPPDGHRPPAFGRGGGRVAVVSASAVASGRLILLGAFASAVAIGFRSQAAVADAAACWRWRSSIARGAAPPARSSAASSGWPRARCCGSFRSSSPSGGPARLLRRLQRPGGRGLVRGGPAGQRLRGPRTGVRALRDVHPPLGRRRVVHRAARRDRRRGPALARPPRARRDHRRVRAVRGLPPALPGDRHDALRAAARAGGGLPGGPGTLRAAARRRADPGGRTGARVRRDDGASHGGLCPRRRAGLPRPRRHQDRGRDAAGRAGRHAPSVCAARGGRRRWAAPPRWRRRRSTSGSNW